MLLKLELAVPYNQAYRSLKSTTVFRYTMRATTDLGGASDRCSSVSLPSENRLTGTS